MIVRPSVFDLFGGQRTNLPGDLIATMEAVPATSATAGVTLTGALLAAGIYLSSAAGALTLTADTAANIQAALAPFFAQNQNAALPTGTVVGGSIQNGTSFRFKVIMSTANTGTIAVTANQGNTVNRGVTAASSSKDYLVTFTNGSPAQSFFATTVNASAVVGLTPAQCALLTPGMIVTNAVAGLQGTTIIGVNIAAGTVTMSGNANATNAAPGVQINFSPTIVFDGL